VRLLDADQELGSLTLGQHLAGGVVHRRQQVHRAAVTACS
jgi:hypothetical protein